MTRQDSTSRRRGVRVSLSIKLALLSAILVVLVAGVSTFVLVHGFKQARERELVARDRELAQILAGLRKDGGRVDFETLTSFVASSDRVDTGLVYALLLDRRGALQQGALNPRLFAKLDARYARAIAQGRRRVLEALASEKLERRGLIKEYALPVPDGHLRLGFDLRRIDALIAAQSRIGVTILGIGLLLGVIGSVLLARRFARPIKHLAAAMEAVAGGDMRQTVQVKASDELAWLAGSFNRMMHALRDAGDVQEKLAPYLGPAVLRRIMREAQALEMVAEERVVTVVALALRGPAGARSDARGRLGMRNDYLAPLIDGLHEHGGTILVVGEEALRAVWGAPEDHPEPERAAIRGALAARAAVAQEARRQTLAGAPTLQLAVGLATGRVAAGNVGSVHRVTYGVVGNAVAIAAAALAEAQPGEILAAESTVSKARDAFTIAAGPPLFLDDLDEAVPSYRVTG